MKPGNFYGIGLGPGDPELLTMKAIHIIQRADCIFVPKSNTKEDSLALEIVQDYVRGKRVTEQVYPMTKDKSVLKSAWLKYAEEIRAEVINGNNVAYLTLGDPMTFSTYIYLLRQLNTLLPEHAIHTIPGITSYNAAACAANFPLLMGDERLAVIPVPKDITELRSIIEAFDTVVLMKVAKKLDEVIQLLEEMQLSENALFASYIGQRDAYLTCDIISLKGSGRGYMSVLIVKGIRH
ncbi:MAG: precorrin-2 C(20)-methyltransferase [Candidatus Brocadia sp. AMX2]|uniref:Precorrin-2 C20-methyltransferase / cobalt-factor-2 C20-methyltransferase n=1 Tax=Candidatus Brocadia sinica JPN1 TaxID=1197129 RepID=A0ABQ0K3D7_9BACT|nr:MULTISPECIES: precorrin-2 C(20)-methyltransferase [Brocadia]MBC6932662.1 precorrin-2 C(20)-methyltransferase [Candidatus Brocadia sp.]MBL1169554.1 precorrin-2 C(20)-methyltransferase [Candidatus Brocadia sp. AMX1]NOG43013.1 precorrin-2 C(20)-methyltransferase [Planctomycetota bacterium]GIK12248.1 MAG: precorrin-2 C(20)-methyltransferase [Candidatus Brocadia sinica]KAA0243905.1 MAG: precorrin-2 C(20)-methyltransferase [Candidatus Brocadia sp. AMX2]